MLNTVKTLVRKTFPFSMRLENLQLKKEIKELKEKLQHRHTEINDLRYTKKELIKKIESIKEIIL